MTTALTTTALDEEDDLDLDSSEQEDDLEEELEEYRKRITRVQRRFTKAGRASKTLGWIALVLLAVAFVSLWSPKTNGFASSVVLTHSMEPYIQVGDIARTFEHDPNKRLEVGDVALIIPEDGSQYLHRVTAVNSDGTYTTQGDNSDLADFFKPTDENIGGVLFNVVRQPEASFHAPFQTGADWFPAVGAALAEGDFATVTSLLPLGPWGWLVLSFASIFFLMGVPRLLNRSIDKINLREAVELERLKRSVASHDETITEHKDSITEHGETIAEVVPVFEEIVHEREKEKALLEEAAQAQEQAWGNWDPSAPIYDEPEEDLNPFVDAFDTDEQEDEPTSVTPLPEVEETLPSLFAVEDETVAPFPVIKPKNRDSHRPLPSDGYPRFMLEEKEPATPTNPFAALQTRRQNVPGEVTGSSLRDELPPLASTPVAPASETRLATSAFDLGEV